MEDTVFVDLYLNKKSSNDFSFLGKHMFWSCERSVNNLKRFELFREQFGSLIGRLRRRKWGGAHQALSWMVTTSVYGCWNGFMIRSHWRVPLQ
jgi:hypothetical protein